MASRAPWTLSTPAVSGVSERSPSTTTTGMSSDSDWAILSTARCGTITTSASTDCSSSVSTALLNASAVIASMLVRVNRNRVGRAAASRPSMTLAGPNWLVPQVTTPMSPERVDASRRAAALRR